jgi:hypothetical protein
MIVMPMTFCVVRRRGRRDQIQMGIGVPAIFDMLGLW